MPARSRVIPLVALISAVATINHLRQPIHLSTGIQHAHTAASSAAAATVVPEENPANRPQCLRPLPHNIPTALHGKLPKPYINLGMPKMGSTSLQAFFQCGGLNSSHYECANHELCATCLKRTVVASNTNNNNTTNKPLSSCGNYDAYVQLDDGSFFPQIEYLQTIHDEFPNATFLLTFRNMYRWYNSISHWPPGAHVSNPSLVMKNRMKNANISGLPSGMGNNVDEFTMWFCNHVVNVRKFVERYSSHSLVELDIEEKGNGELLGSLFGIRVGCWGHANKNPGFGR